MKAIHCAIKKTYLDMIRKGTKDSEYRDMSEYWIKKLCNVPEGVDMQQYRADLISGKVKPLFKDFTHIVFHCQGDTLTLPITGIRTHKGHSIFAIGLDLATIRKEKKDVK